MSFKSKFFYQNKTASFQKENYDDLLELPHPEPKNRHRMSQLSRAAQFAPFSALAGYEQAIKESSRHTEVKAVLAEEKLEQLNRTFALAQGQPLCFTIFQKDTKKKGGQIVTFIDSVKKIDEIRRCLILQSGKSVNFDDILELEMAESDTEE